MQLPSTRRHELPIGRATPARLRGPGRLQAHMRALAMRPNQGVEGDPRRAVSKSGRAETTLPDRRDAVAVPIKKSTSIGCVERWFKFGSSVRFQFLTDTGFRELNLCPPPDSKRRPE